MSINEHREAEEPRGLRAALTSQQQHLLLEGAQQCCSASPQPLSRHLSLAASAAETTVPDIDVAGEDSACFTYSDDCDTPRYIPCKARYGVGSTAVLVELLHDMDD
ncbi:hypothetical protein LDHU3_10.1550:CDS1 [Leishmania donovani]|uniref:Hypothetical_protein n=2 Tax=Leishmania donovani species complex TaxID=38574 RepID=A0A6L0WJX5_LEIIN|nr:hypothetical protein LdCL_100018900 [Leishmania donovani]CAC9458790.1 hypothetical_protein [Leishmania infantum]TPP46557.1 hypothetical protein CGC21_23320 [Leishmania donovani]TPP52576.1 hypothetical protein CGC20_35560 [Leishmania donovani]CAJ1986799.1 hypothetical protein LDHU3_10.1550:CDS1 [Leishmania donovani]